MEESVHSSCLTHLDAIASSPASCNQQDSTMSTLESLKERFRNGKESAQYQTLNRIKLLYVLQFILLQSSYMIHLESTRMYAPGRHNPGNWCFIVLRTDAIIYCIHRLPIVTNSSICKVQMISPFIKYRPRCSQLVDLINTNGVFMILRSDVTIY